MTDYFEHIEDYKNHRLSEEAKKAFELAMVRDDSLQHAVDNHEVAMDVLDGIYEDQLRGMISEHDKQKKKLNTTKTDKNTSLGTTNKKKKNWWWMIGLLAIIFLITIFVLKWSAKETISNTTQFAQIYNPPSWPLQRGDDHDDISKAMSMYFNGNKNQAKSKLSLLESPISQYWLSELYLLEERMDSTLYHLPNMDMIPNKKDRIHFMHILSLYYSGKKDDAIKLIQNLPSDISPYYKKKYEKL